ncbi:RcnB family protein [Brevundimonas vitis]|jgi:Ni/Co efflux regulator RcnB|uniref:RcnB family protein n=1 Tax=Brevundimonas vitisensis TaxID=2800818 RepID=A0ABX7BN10_9CAUL|nr:RcnB family protein [Brevundimonas vitisensis]QQQ18964.1 RcnB family protein [Brevundimonas vitisensis]
MNRFTRAAVIAIALGTTAVPMIAQAQSRDDRRERRDDRRDYRQDRRDDRRDFREERRDDRRDRRNGQYDNRRDYREDRRDDRRDFREERREDRREFREDRRWDRNNRDWWRGRSDFRDYNGRRNGQWYAPGYGYYRVEPRYYGYSWRRGSYLPPAYHRYAVRDPYFYNLRPAPRGYRWVHVDNDIVLVALATGLIADLVFDIW